MKRKRVVVLGATGSIGESAAKVARDIPERVEIVGIAANSKARELAAQANELRPPAVCIVDETKVSELRKNLSYQPQIFSGETGLREIASGVPFRETPAEKFSQITVEQALKHPTWNMGPKITIDSATLFNKGLEMIEAHWLFGVGMAQVEVVIHPQSIVHSMVEFADGSVLAQLSHSNMCFPIQYAVTWPDRVPNSLPPLDFGKLAELKFAPPRYDDFPALGLARRAGETGGTLPAVLYAANGIAGSAFLEKRMRFPQIWQTVEQVMNAHASVAHPNLDEILRADQWARAEAGRH